MSLLCHCCQMTTNSAVNRNLANVFSCSDGNKNFQIPCTYDLLLIHVFIPFSLFTILDTSCRLMKTEYKIIVILFLSLPYHSTTYLCSVHSGKL